MMSIEQLRQQYKSGAVRFTEGAGGYPCLDVSTALAEARVYLYGAHLAHYQPAGQKPVLFMSKKSFFTPGKPIRGGVPLCFPWFGPREDASSPMHGFARLQSWEVSEINQGASGEVAITLELGPTEFSRGYWPHDFRLQHRIIVGKTLTMSLTTQNLGTAAFTITEAQHTYFSVGDVRKVKIKGLEDTLYMDKNQSMNRFSQRGVIELAGPIDQHHLNTGGVVTIEDPSLGRAIRLSKSGSQTTVVWNPWSTHSARFADLGPEEWQELICVETANEAENRVQIEPGGTHKMQSEIAVA